MKGNIWIPGILEVFCLQTLESGILGFGIQYSAQRIPSSDWNPQSTIHVPLARNPESSSWAMVPLPSWGGGGICTRLYTGFVLFFEQSLKKIKEVHKNFLAPIRRQNGGDRLELVW